MDVTPLSFAELATYSLHERESKVTVENFGRPLPPGSRLADFFASLPDQLLGRDFPELIEQLSQRHLAGRPLLIGMGAHVIKVGLTPILIDLMKRGLVAGFALNGACVVHDTEIAMAGRTSEDVGAVLGQGAFGAARETGACVNAAVAAGAQKGLGLGAAMGEYLLAREFPHLDQSLLAMARKMHIPVTVHVAIGTDIVHIHPQADGAAIGQTSYRDFQIFCRLVSQLDGGSYLNFGSAVLLPEVFLKALTVVRNLGHPVKDIVTANFDFIKQYRPMTNVVCRPTAEGGRGYTVVGHHELMIPLLAAGLVDRLAAKGEV